MRIRRIGIPASTTIDAMPRGMKERGQAYAREVFTELVNSKRTQTEIGEEVGVDQSQVSKIAQHGKTSVDVAIRAAHLAGRPQEEIDRELGLVSRRVRRNGADPSDPKIGTLLIGLLQTPGLHQWCTNNPGAVRVSQVLRAIETYPNAPAYTVDPKFGPVDGWAAYFEALEAGEIGEPTATKGTAGAAEALERLEHPGLPPTHAVKALPPGPKPRVKRRGKPKTRR